MLALRYCLMSAPSLHLMYPKCEGLEARSLVNLITSLRLSIYKDDGKLKMAVSNWVSKLTLPSLFAA